MPDIKTALEQALSKAQTRAQLPAEWDDEGGAAVIESITTQAKEATMPKQFFVTTNNVTRITFDYVRDNPGKTRKEVAVALQAQGFKNSSVTSLLGQMVKQGVMRENAQLLYTTTNEYAPLKSSKKLALLNKPQAPVKAAAKPRPPFIPVPAEAAPQINAAWDAETLLNNLSIKQARALYDELRKIFGG